MTNFLQSAVSLPCTRPLSKLAPRAWPRQGTGRGMLRCTCAKQCCGRKRGRAGTCIFAISPYNRPWNRADDAIWCHLISPRDSVWGGPWPGRDAGTGAGREVAGRQRSRSSLHSFRACWRPVRAVIAVSVAYTQLLSCCGAWRCTREKL